MNPFFKLKFEQIKSVESNILVPRKAVLNDETNEVISVVGEKYQLIENQSVVTELEKVLNENGIKFNKLDTRLSGKTQAKFSSKYKLPEIKVNMGKVESKYGKPLDDNIQMMFEVFNSYDGSGKVGFSFGGYRLVCLNGLRMFEEMFRIALQHTGNVREELAGQFQVAVNTGINTFRNEIAQGWDAMKLMNFDKLRAYEVLKALELGVRYEKAINEVFAARIAAGQLKTMWDFYNMTTWFASHVVEERNPALAAKISAVSAKEIVL